MKYTILYGHNSDVLVELGQVVKTGDILARMGNTGYSTGAHVHLSVVQGEHTNINDMRLSMLNSARTIPDKQQCDYFVMDDLCDNGIEITTQYLEEQYRNMFGIDHPAYDLVVNSSDKTYKWNRSWEGLVVAKGHDNAYGNYLMIVYDTTKKEEEYEYLSNPNYQGVSIVDALNQIGVDSSKEYRTKLAHVNGITDYNFTAEQNTQLLNLLKQGKLTKA